MSGAPGTVGVLAERKAMTDRDHEPSASRQAKALGISESRIYALPRPASDADLELMRRTCELHPEASACRRPMLKGRLAGEGCKVGRLHVPTLMKRMAAEAISRCPNTSKPVAGHRIHPCLLRNLAATHPDQAWAMDIPYIPRARGFVCLAAVGDGFSRKGSAWALGATTSSSSGSAIREGRESLPAGLCQRLQGASLDRPLLWLA